MDAATQRSGSPAALFTQPEFLSLATVQLARGTARSTILVALALYADMFALSGLIAGLFGTVYALSRLVFVLPVGEYVDRGNEKWYLLCGLVLNGMVLVGFIFVETFSHIIGLRLLQGLSAVFIVIAGTSIVGQIAPEDDRGLWIGTYKQTKAFASLAGDLVGGALLFVYGFTVAYTVLFGLTAIAVVTVFSLLRDLPSERPSDERDALTETLRHLLRRRSIQALMLFRFTFSFGRKAMVIFLPIYARTEFGMNAFMIGGIMAGGKMTKALVQGHVGDLSDRVGHLSWFIVAAALVYAVGAAVMPLATYAAETYSPIRFGLLDRRFVVLPSFVVLFGAYLLLGISDSLRIPISNTLFVNEGENVDAVGSSLSLRIVPSQVGGIVGPFVVGWILDLLSFTVAFWFTAALAVVSAGIFVGLYNMDPPAPEAVPAEN